MEQELRRRVRQKAVETSTINNNIVCSGGFIISKDTKRFLFLQRSNGKSAGSWGIVGGKKEPHDITPFDALKREILEEIGIYPNIQKIIPLELFVSNDYKFEYNSYVLLVEREFIPLLNSEHSGYAWCSFENWPKPLHRGVKNTLSNKTINSKLELLLLNSMFSLTS